MSPSELLLGGLKSALDLMKPNLQHQVEKEQEREKFAHDHRAVNLFNMVKKYMQEIMIKERRGYQPRYLKNLVHNCLLWNYFKIRWYGIVILINYDNAMEKILTS